MIDIELIIMLGLLIFCFYWKIKYGIFFLCFWVFTVSFGFFLSANGICIDNQSLDDCEIYYEILVGDYQKLYPKLKIFHNICKKLKLSEIYKPFGIFYDNPLEIKDINKSRSIIGILIFKKDINKDDKKFLDFKKYMNENKYQFNFISKTNCIYGFYNCFFSIRNSLLFIAKIYIKIINQKFFARLYNPRWKENTIKQAKRSYKKKKGVMEIFDHQLIQFYIPIGSDENNFNLI